MNGEEGLEGRVRLISVIHPRSGFDVGEDCGEKAREPVPAFIRRKKLRYPI